MEKTVGEKRIRTEFNPSALDNVSLIKQKSAELINLLEKEFDNIKGDPFGERIRLIRLAQTAYEEGAMWAVKAATF